jgi:hypothetical protein
LTEWLSLKGDAVTDAVGNVGSFQSNLVAEGEVTLTDVGVDSGD